MTVIFWLLTVYAALALLYWLWMAYGVVRLAGLPSLSGVKAPEPQAWPKLSVVVPACNEADKIEPALRSLLAEDYPGLEIIVVDDRSIDTTGEIIDRLAAADGRVKVLHITELPEGWLGKVNALNRGLKISTGEFVLFTDADVHFTPGVLRRAVAYAMENKLDHLAAFPDLWPTNIVVDSTISAAIRQIMTLARVWAVGNPKSRACVGIGAFNLVRRSAFADTPGFEWLRLETADDMGVGVLMKTHGKRCGLVCAFDYLGLHWYRSLREAAHGCEKGWASALHFSVLRAVAGLLAAPALELAPVLTLLPLLSTDLRLVGLLGIPVLLAFLFAAITLGLWAKGRLLPALLSPLTVFISAVFVVRTAWLGLRRGGVLWRGTLYKTEELRKGMRVFFP